MFRKIVVVLAAVLLASIAISATQQKTPITKKVLNKKVSHPMVTIEMAKGTIKFEMFPESAPKTVARITELIKKGFYNNLTFHRVVPGFVVQGGDPLGNGVGGTGVKIPAEFNSRKHVTGTVAMARSMDINSGDCQFYICLADQPGLDNNYTIFGQVVSGMDVVNKIRVGDVMKKVTVTETEQTKEVNSKKDTSKSKTEAPKK